MICIIQINEEEHRKSGAGRINLPPYLEVDRDITDVDAFWPINMASLTYK